MEEDHQATRNHHGQAQDIDNRMQPVPDQISEGDGQIIPEHSSLLLIFNRGDYKAQAIDLLLLFVVLHLLGDQRDLFNQDQDFQFF